MSNEGLFEVLLFQLIVVGGALLILIFKRPEL